VGARNSCLWEYHYLLRLVFDFMSTTFMGLVTDAVVGEDMMLIDLIQDVLQQTGRPTSVLPGKEMYAA
jgi:hypothetical protein